MRGAEDSVALPPSVNSPHLKMCPPCPRTPLPLFHVEQCRYVTCLSHSGLTNIPQKIPYARTLLTRYPWHLPAVTAQLRLTPDTELSPTFGCPAQKGVSESRLDGPTLDLALRNRDLHLRYSNSLLYDLRNLRLLRLRPDAVPETSHQRD